MTMDEKVEEEEDDDEMEEMNRAKHISPGDEATRMRHGTETWDADATRMTINCDRHHD